MVRRIAIVVPEIAEMGGVRSLARFALDTIRTRPDFQPKVISLPMSSRDAGSTLLTRPSTWLRGIQTTKGDFDGQPYTQVGAHAAEIEYFRLRPRAALSALIEDCDLIQVVAGTPYWALPVLGLGKPVVLHVATLTSLERRLRLKTERGAVAGWRSAMTKLSVRMDERALKAVEAIFVMNTWMLDYARKLETGHDTIVCYAPPGVDSDRFSPPPEGARASNYILSVSRFDDPRKNLGMLLESYALLCARMSDPPRLVLAGSRAPTAGFWARVESLGLAARIRYVERPSKDDLIALYRDAWAFALPSDEEGFGIVVVEAMSCGVPVVVTRCGGPDAIVTDGIDGYLVERGNSNEMADRLDRIFRDPASAREMGRRARATVEARYANAVAGKVFLDVYDRLLSRPA
jgi:glycosyltransferase involved in cell wall biosynthesis